MKTLLLWLVYLGCVVAFASSGPGPGLPVQTIPDAPDVDDIMGVREDFTYEVRYGFFNLGTITINIISDTTYSGQPVRYLFYKILSNRSIPFVGYKERHYHAYMAHNDTTFYELKFWTDSIHDEIYDETIYDYDYPGESVYTFEEGEAVDTLELTEPGGSGPAFFYFARLHAGSGREVDYPIYISHEKGKVELQNYDRIESYSSAAFPGDDVEAVRTRGYADLDGPFGFRGRIDAIFMADELRIPLEARVRVWIGNVVVRLVDYERTEG
ncbi:MAG: hypothetical protein WD266_06660 [Balneolales bacterium]